MNLLALVIVVSLISFQISLNANVGAAQLGVNGGYSISVAIEEGTEEPTNPEELVENIIKKSFLDLSSEMWRATEESFFLKEIDIVIPYHWNYNSPVEGDTDPVNLKSYHNADIRISPNIPRPRTAQNNQCLRPGEFIELPYSFFSDNSAYGSDHWKSLLHLWARYRWGVWEEHGHPGDHRFPYFSKENPNDKNWQTTGCSNVELKGDYVDLNDDSAECQLDGLYPPSSSCRFEPSEIGNEAVTSSLMHFPWIKSVVKFCNDVDEPHDINFPNRHNLFCGYQSTLAVIRNSEDKKHATNPPSSNPDPIVKIHRNTNRPLLYLLLDNGVHLIPPGSFVLVKSELKDLFDSSRMPSNTRAKLNVFDPKPGLVLPIEWSTINNIPGPGGKPTFDRFINDFVPESSDDRLFSQKIKAAVEEMYKLNPVNGGILVILKTGAKAKFNELKPNEEELINIVKGRPVKIFAIEIEENALTPRINLESICRESGGKHLRLTRKSDIQAEVRSLIESVIDIFSESAVPVTNTDYILLREHVAPNTEIRFPTLQYENLIPLRIVLTTEALIGTANVIVNPDGPKLVLEQKREWNEAGSKSRHVLQATLESIVESVEILEWIKYTCAATAGCDGDLIVYGESVGQGIVNIQITTSSQDIKFDSTPGGSSDLVSQFPLSIFAEVSENGKQLKGLTVTAFVIQPSGDAAIPVKLRNNGQPPDLFPNDGVYSGVFVPTENGDYKISVKITYEYQFGQNSLNQEVRLLPVDQNDVTCGGEGSCDARFPTRALERVWDFLYTITVSNVDIFQPVPAPILNLNSFASNDFNVTLEWTAPYIIGQDDDTPVASYVICRGETRRQVLDDATVCKPMLLDEGPKKPGEMEIYHEEFIDGNVIFFALKSLYNEKPSLLSNIVGVYPQSIVITTTTQRSTTTEAPPTVTKGYNVAIAFEEGIPRPIDYNKFFSELKVELNKLSEEMFATTFKRFYISSADIVIPNNWDVGTLESESKTLYSMRTANIRISDKTLVPRTENPNPCGLPGNFIELPYSFYNETANLYGDQWKALLHLWARYRWGVWEEHGFEGSSKFPYFFKRPRTELWEATGCSYPTLQGIITNSKNESCNISKDLEPETDCRFRPSEPYLAKSSLMHFHWVESVEKFCNEDTHNKHAPNRQNLFCHHRSVSEVIHGSLDLEGADELINEIPPIVFNVKKTSPKPLFYLLLDDGQSPVVEAGFNPIRSLLIKLFEDRIPKKSFAGIGKFPSVKSEGSYVDEVVPLSAVSFVNMGNFTKAIEEFPSREILFRDFGRAIHETVNKIKKFKHEKGNVLLVVKTGAGPNTFDKMMYEEEVIASVKEHNIKIFIIELRNSNLRPQIHLENFVERLGGTHLTLENAGTGLIPAIENITREIVAELDFEFQLPTPSKMLFKGMVNSKEGLNIKVVPNSKHISDIHISLTSLTGEILLNSTNIQLEHREFTLEAKKEWGITDEGISRELVFGSQDTKNLGPSAGFVVSFTCVKPTDECAGFLVIEGELHANRQPDPFNISISTSISELNNVLDLSQDKQSTIPFAVFVKVEENGRPLRSIEKIEATFQQLGKPNYITFPLLLKDNGYGTPDTFQDDGVYSGTFIPTEDGTYNLFITIAHMPYKDIIPGASRLRYQNQQIGADNYANRNRLLPIDQIDTGCSSGQCNSRVSSQNIAHVVEFSDPIVVKNTRLWRGKTVPAQILDLTAWALDGYNISLKWTSPFSIGRAQLKATHSELGISSVLEALTEFNFVWAERISEVKESGTVQQYTFQAEPDRVYYFALRNCIERFCSRPSNIVGVLSREEELITPTKPPITTTEEPVKTTTRTTISTILPTTRSTTTRRTTKGTTENPTTEEDITYWYERTEGIITLSVFGGTILLLGIGAFLYVCIKNKMDNPEPKYSRHI